MSIVIGYRPDDFGELALEHGVARAQATSSPLVIVNLAKRGVDSTELEASKGFVRGHELEQLRFRLVEAVGAKRMAIRQPVGSDTAAEILAVASDVKADLVVIGLRPRSPVGKFVLGSTAWAVLLDSTAPVLAVKPRAGSAPVL